MATHMDTSEYDWQSRKSVIECNRHMLKNKLLCDVMFRVGSQGEIIEAHKFVLASRSCVFYAMFSDVMMEQQGRVIDIPDIEADIFKAVMQFLYYEEIKIDLNNVLALLYIAKKYSIQALIDKCTKRLRSRLDPANICTVLEAAHMYDDTQLKNDCLTVILRTPLEVFQSDDFQELGSECLSLILKEDKLPLDEQTVYESVMMYARKKCMSKGLLDTPQNMRLVLGSALRHIRFPIMDANYFSDVVEPSGILEDEESLVVMKYLLRKRNECEIFSTAPRSRLKSIYRFEELESGWGYNRNKQDSVIFSASANLLIHGIVVYGSCNIPAEYSIKMALKQTPFYAMVADKPNIILKTDGAQKVYNLLFDKPAEIKKDKEYSISVTFKEGSVSSFRGMKGLAEIEQDGITFKFMKCAKSTNNTNESTGQIPGILYEVLPE